MYQKQKQRKGEKGTGAREDVIGKREKWMGTREKG